MDAAIPATTIADSPSEAPQKTRYTRDELYELVWSEAMRTLAPKFGMSDVGLAKVCKRMRIPRPGLRYWAKKAAGQPVKRARLPEVLTSAPSEVREFVVNRSVHSRGRRTGKWASRWAPPDSWQSIALLAICGAPK